MSKMKRMLGSRAALALGPWIVYTLAFIPLYRLVGPTLTALAMLPVVVTGWLFGMRAGLLAGLLAFLLDVLLVTLAGKSGWDVMIRGLPGSGLLVLIGPVVGRLRDLGERAKWELTERKRAEEAFTESEDRFRTVFEEVADMITYVDIHGKILDVNNRVEDLLGYKRDEVIGKNFAKLGVLGLKDLPKMVTLFRDTIRDSEAVRMVELELKHKDGNRVFAEVSTRFIKKNGKAEGVVNIFRDITERKQADEALHRSLEETARGQLLLLALSQVAQAVQRARTPDEVYRIVLDEVARLGYHATFATLTENRTHLTMSHMTFEPAILRTAEKLVGLSTQGYSFPLVPGGLYDRIIAEGETTFSEQSTESMAESLPRRVRPLAGRLAAVLGIEQAIYAPLTIGGETHGLLTVIGADLTEADAPAITAFANQTAIALENALAQEALRQQTHDLDERLKELNCLYGISALVDKPGILPEEILQGTVDLIPPAWRYPEAACARIILEGQEFTTENFRETTRKQTADIIVHGERIGRVEVCYLEEKPECDEGPFLKEERNLINAIAEQVESIVERKRAEEALRESKDLLHVVIDATPALILVKDRDGKFILANEETARLYGRTPEEMAGKSLPELVDMSPSDRILFDEYLEGDREVIDSKQPHFIPEEPLTLPGGTTIWVQTTQVPLAIEGNPDCMLSIGADITERRRAEEALQRSLEETARSQRLLLALSQATQAVQRARTPDEVHRIVADEVAGLGYHAMPLTLTDDREHLTAPYLTSDSALQRAAEKAGLSAQDFRFPLVPGGFFQWIIAEGETAFVEPITKLLAEALPRPVRPLAGRVAAMLGLEQGIVAPVTVGGETHGLLMVTGAGLTEADVPAVTAFANQTAIALENVRLYQEVSWEKEKFEGAARHMAEGVIILDENCLITFANPQAYGLLSLEEDPQGRPFSEVCSHPQMVSLLRKAFDHKGIAHGEVTLDQPLPHDLSVSVAPVSYGEEEPLWYVTVLHDITQLKEVDRMRSEFVSMVSHELRTPLASIMGYTEVLLSGKPGELTSTQREFLDISYESSERLLHLVDELLDASRIDAGRLRLSFELLRMKRLVARLVEAIKPVAEGKGITISIEAPGRLPPLEGDRNRLEQVMNNLLSNAIKFTPEGGRVSVSLSRDADRVRVRVTDTGTGIPSDELPRLFQKFSRMSSATEQMIEGTGLGLYITKAIVEGHGGRIWAESEPGKGSAFWFALPLRQPRPAEVRQEELARDIAARFFDSPG